MKSQIPIHDQENNSDSQSFREENEQKLKEGCMKVLRILNTGARLTVLEAINKGISSLPRRVMDLRIAGFDIKDEWIKNDEGKRLYKEWWLPISKRPTKEQVIEAMKKGDLVQTKMEL